jgi:hypothetical protein
LSLAYVPVDVPKSMQVEHEHDSGTLHLDILQAKNLKSVDSNGQFILTLGLSDPYIVCKLNGVQFHKTKTIKKTLNPIYDETLQTPVSSRYSAVINFDIYDSNTIKKDVLIGSISYCLNLLEIGKVTDFEIEIDQGGVFFFRLFFDPGTIISEEINMEKLLSKDSSGVVMKFTKSLTKTVFTSSKSAILLPTSVLNLKKDKSDLKSRESQLVFDGHSRASEGAGVEVAVQKTFSRPFFNLSGRSSTESIIEEPGIAEKSKSSSPSKSLPRRPFSLQKSNDSIPSGLEQDIQPAKIDNVRLSTSTNSSPSKDTKYKRTSASILDQDFKPTL